MHVLHVIPSVAPRYGGPSHAILGMGQALQRQNVDVLVATTDADGPERLPVQLGRSVDWCGIPAIFFQRQWSEAWKYSRPLARWLDAHVGEFELVHIHAVFSHACVAAAQACDRRGVPYIVRPLGSLDPWSLRQKRLRKRILWHLGVKRLLLGAAAIHYTTASEQRLAETPLGLNRGVVVPLGVDDVMFDSAPAEQTFRTRCPSLNGDPYLLLLGRVHPKKGLEMFFDVFLHATNPPEHRNWRVVVAGDGETKYVRGLKHWVRERGAAQRILFTGWLAGMEKLAALQGAAMLVLPSRQENFGIVVAEAMACGVPVLVSTHVNLADEIGAVGAGWVAPLERSALLACLLEALTREDERLRRGVAGREFARNNFRWSAIGASLLGLYRRISTANRDLGHVGTWSNMGQR